MLEGLLALLVTIVVVGIVVYLAIMLLNMVPMDENFKQIARVLIILIGVLVILIRAWPLLTSAIATA